MAIVYPAQIDDTISLPLAIDGVTNFSASSFNLLREAIIRVEGELGVNPASIYGTVRNRIDLLETTLNNLLVSLVNFAGDLSGNNISQTVIGLQGRPINSMAPSTNQVLAWDGSQWKPITLTGSTIAVQEEGTTIGVHGTINFIGSSITAVDNPGQGRVDITVTGVPDTRTLIAGAGLTGGGDLSADRTFNVVANADGSITVNANDIQVGILATDAQHGSRGGGSQHAAVVSGGAAGFITGASQLKLDGIATGATNTPLASANPTTIQPDATASPGVGTTAARDDHTHAIVADVPVNVTKAAAAEGSSTSFSRADHKHDITTATPIDIGTANSEGTATTLARSDHVHNTPFTAVNTALGTANASISVNSQKITNVLDPTAAQDAATKNYVDSRVNFTMMWGDAGVSTTTVTRYLTPCISQGTALTAPTQFRMPFACTFKNMRVRHNTGAGNGNNIVYTLRKNGVATAVTVTLASTGNDGSDLTNTVAFAAGDLVDIEVTKAASIGTSPSEIVLILQGVN